MKDILLTIIASIITIGLAVMFGLLSKPTEMGLIVVAGAIVLAFLNINKIQKFKGAGFEAEMKRAVDEANATIEQLREVAATSAGAILTDLMAGNFFDGTTLETRLNLHDQLIVNLKEIGASDRQIERADRMWKKGIGVTFYRGIRNALEGLKDPFKINDKTDPRVLEVSKEFQNLLNFKEWSAPSSDETRKFIVERGVMSDQVEELLKDYAEFEKSGTFRRRELFVNL